MLPSNVSTGRVEGRFIVGVEDGPDVDSDPDFIAAQGTIEFTASVPYLPNPTAVPAPVTMLKTAIRGVLDAEGYLCTMNAAGSPGVRGLRLVATDDPDLLVQNWTWMVTYQFTPVNGSTPAIAAHSIALPSDTTVDLTTAIKVPASPGVGLPQAEAAVLRAEAAATDSAQSAAVAQDVVTRANAGEFDGDLLTMGAVTAVAPGGTPTATLTGTSPNKVLELGLVKGEPGGFVLGTSIPMNSDLNTYITDGIYRQAATTVTGALNYPRGTNAGILRVHTAMTGLVVQEFIHVAINDTTYRTYTHKRTLFNGAWTPWATDGSVRVDNTAGRAMYMWDDTAGREQLIYGDTGKRRVESLLVNGWKATYFSMRRIGSDVHLFAVGLDSTASTSPVAIVAPAGFRDNAVSASVSPRAGAFTSSAGSTSIPMRTVYSTGNLEISSSVAAAIVLSVSWATNDPWPTSLPGIADGAIPNL